MKQGIDPPHCLRTKKKPSGLEPLVILSPLFSTEIEQGSLIGAKDDERTILIRWLMATVQENQTVEVVGGAL